jgi:hypothetical protein
VDELQRASIQLEAWTDDNKMTIQSDKSTWMMVSLGIQKEQLEMEYAGEKVAREEQVIGLGVALDYMINMQLT